MRLFRCSSRRSWVMTWSTCLSCAFHALVFRRRASFMRRAGPEEQGIGFAKLLKHRLSGMVRVEMQEQQTMKIVSNFFVNPNPPRCTQRSFNRDNSWVWAALDCSSGWPCERHRLLRVASQELALEFKDAFQVAKEVNAYWASWHQPGRVRHTSWRSFSSPSMFPRHDHHLAEGVGHEGEKYARN